MALACGCYSDPTTKDAYRLSVASIIITLLAMFVGMRLFVNLVDFLSSAVVLWRFFAPQTVDETLERQLKEREERASVAISFIMVLLGFFIMGTAIDDAQRGEEDLQQEGAVLVISFWSVIFFGVLTMLKFQYSTKLDSTSLYKDGICSLIGTVLAGSLFINTILIIIHPGLWWIDPLVSFIAGIIALVLGVQALRAYSASGLPIYTQAFWMSGKAPKTTTTNDDDDNAGEMEGNVELPPNEVV